MKKETLEMAKKKYEEFFNSKYFFVVGITLKEEKVPTCYGFREWAYLTSKGLNKGKDYFGMNICHYKTLETMSEAELKWYSGLEVGPIIDEDDEETKESILQSKKEWGFIHSGKSGWKYASRNPEEEQDGVEKILVELHEKGIINFD